MFRRKNVIAEFAVAPATGAKLAATFLRRCSFASCTSHLSKPAKREGGSVCFPGNALHWVAPSFNLVTFVTLLTFVLPCHLIVSDFCLRSCVERRPWDLSSRRRFSFARFQ